jgi:Domain of unknown function (DUF4157)
LRPYVAELDLDRAMLHLGLVPWYLGRRFCAIVRGKDVYVRPGMYVPDTAEGLALLGHELTHVSQYRSGMTALKYLCAALRGYANNKYEQEAFAVQAAILRDFASRAGPCDGTDRQRTTDT